MEYLRLYTDRKCQHVIHSEAVEETSGYVVEAWLSDLV